LGVDFFLDSTNQKNKKRSKKTSKMTREKGLCQSDSPVKSYYMLLEKFFTAETVPSVIISLVFGRFLSDDDYIDGKDWIC
jgi:hypothetical protein